MKTFIVVFYVLFFYVKNIKDVQKKVKKTKKKQKIKRDVVCKIFKNKIGMGGIRTLDIVYYILD